MWFLTCRRVLRLSIGIGNRTGRISSKWNYLSRTFSGNASVEKPPDGIFVQTLPVHFESSLRHPTQDLTNPEIKRKILLCKWSSGDFKDRFTGLIKRLEPEQFTRIHEAGTEEKKIVLRQLAVGLLPKSLVPFLKEIELVGLLRFADPPECDEYVYIAYLAHPFNKITENNNSTSKSTIDFSEIIRFDEEKHPCFWFNWKEIPFPEMPADDELWYPEVLWKGNKVKGSFTFGGWSEKTIKSYKLSCVNKIL